MKQVFVSLFALIMISWTCGKDEFISARNESCEIVVITQQGLGCDLWGIKVDGRIYPAFNLPDQYKKEGTTACVEYVLYEDMRNCPAPCCGGIWANIKSIQ